MKKWLISYDFISMEYRIKKQQVVCSKNKVPGSFYHFLWTYDFDFDA